MEFTINQLTSLIRKHLPEVESAPSFEPVPTGKFNTSYWVTADGEEYVLRIAPPRDSVFLFYERDMMRQEPGIHALLLEKTSVPVAPIIGFDDTGELIGRDYLIMRRLPGKPLTEVAWTDRDSVFRQVGEYLAQAHALHREQYGYLGEHHPMKPRRRWVDAFHVMWNNLIDDIDRTGLYEEEDSNHMRHLLDHHIRVFDRPVASSLLHMDIWSQNILVDGEAKVTGIVDWDRALWGDPEIEFAVLDYCGVSEPAFWEGYGAERDLSPEARTRQVFYFLYELQKYIVIRHGRNNDTESARAYKGQVIEIVNHAFG